MKMEELTKEELVQKLQELQSLKRIAWHNSLKDGFYCMASLLFLANTFIIDYLSLEMYLQCLNYYLPLLLVGSLGTGYILQRKPNKNIDLNINELKKQTLNSSDQDKTLKLK